MQDPQITTDDEGGGSECWEKARLCLSMANAAFKLAAKNKHGRQMVVEYLKRAIEELESTPNDPEFRDAAL